FDIAEPVTRKIRQLQPADARDVPQRIRAEIAVLRRVRHFPNTDAIEHDPDYAVEHKPEGNTPGPSRLMLLFAPARSLTVAPLCRVHVRVGRIFESFFTPDKEARP